MCLRSRSEAWPPSETRASLQCFMPVDRSMVVDNIEDTHTHSLTHSLTPTYPQPKQIPWNLEEKQTLKSSCKTGCPWEQDTPPNKAWINSFFQRAEGWSREQAGDGEGWQREGHTRHTHSPRCQGRKLGTHTTALVERRFKSQIPSMRP